jgi:SAM-dependent methyltransferase
MLKKLINSQIWLSRSFDKLLPHKYRIDGNQDYINSLVPKYLGKNITMYDIGGGKRPYLSVKEKEELNAIVVGVDIDGDELSRAPLGAYDEVIISDISKYKGYAKADVLVCQAVLEHVKDVERAFEGISSALKPDGLALIFVPSRSAIFAKLNVLLPQKIKEYILYLIYPEAKEDQGFPSYYNKCTPEEFKRMAAKNGLSVIEERYYFISNYFSFFFPAYLVWRIWVLLFSLLYGDQAAETFSLVAKKMDNTREKEV